MTKLIETKSIILFLLFSNLSGQDKGQKLFEQEKYDEARKYYESILEKRDEDKAALFGVGSSAYYQNDIEGALNSFGNTLDSGDDQLKSKSYFNLARILQDKNELEKSLAFYRKSLELNPADIDAKVNYELLKRQISQNQNQKMRIKKVTMIKRMKKIRVIKMNRQKIIKMKIKVISKTLLEMRTKIVKRKMKKMNWLIKTKKSKKSLRVIKKMRPVKIIQVKRVRINLMS